MMSKHGSQTAILTGATGFIGTRLARHLIEEGWNVSALVRQTSSAEALQRIGLRLIYDAPHPWTTHGDVLPDLVAQIRPDVVFHLASLFRAEHAPGEATQLIESNILLGTRLLDAVRQYNDSQSANACFVTAGTSWQYHTSGEIRPVNLYAATKQAFEVIMQSYAEIYDINNATLLLFDTYGPGDHRPKLLRLLHQIAQSGAPLSMSPGEQRIDLVHVDDVVEAFVRAAQGIISGEFQGFSRFAVSSGMSLSLRELVVQIEHTLGRALPITWGERPYRAREVMEPWFTGQPLPGWHPKISLADGLAFYFGSPSET